MIGTTLTKSIEGGGFLEDLINGEYNELLDTIYTQKMDDSYSGIEQQYMQIF